MSIITCLRCQGSMEPGFILDRGRHDAPGQQRWVEGTPVRSFWTGLKLKGRSAHLVMTYRCPRCGYLESHAPTVAPL